MAATDDNVRMTLFISIAALAALGVLTQRFGADSRPGFDERSPLS
jgi:hypothetical protein